MIIELPLSSDPAQTMVTQLGDVKYQIEAKYNDRSGVWTLDLAVASTSDVIVQSLPLVIGQDLLEPYNFDMGSLLVVDTSGRHKDAGPDDLGSRVKVYWFSPDEVAAL